MMTQSAAVLYITQAPISHQTA